jgi:hypothetical protein
VKKLLGLFAPLLMSAQPASAEVDNSVSGDHDRWILFERETGDGYPLVVLARFGNPLTSQLIEHGLLTTVECVADQKASSDQRMPANTQNLYPLEDLLGQSEALRRGKALHLASVTGDGRRRIIYGHLKEIAFEPIVSGFSAVGFACSVKAENARSRIAQLIAPTALDIQLDGDRSVIESLAKQGDDGLLPRKTDFWFYGSKSARQKLAADLASLGFTVDHETEDGKGIVLSRTMPVTFSDFRELTPKLLSAVQQTDIEYDGWETSVEKRN